MFKELVGEQTGWSEGRKEVLIHFWVLTEAQSTH